MANPTPIKSWLYATNIRNTLFGTMTPNQKDLVWRWKNALLGFAGAQWTVVRSSTPSTLGAAGVDLWTSGSSLARPGGSIGVYSWINLRRKDGAQVVIAVSVDVGWLEVVIYFSVAAGFAGGIAGVRPTASDEIELISGNGSAYFGNNGSPGANTQYTLHVWQSDDGTCTMTALYAGSGTATQMFWALPTARDPVQGWTHPVLSLFQYAGNNQNTPAACPDINSLMPPSADMRGYVTGPGVMHLSLSMLGTFGSFARVISQWSHADELSGKWILIQSGIFSQVTVGARSAGLGRIPDIWWGFDASFNSWGTYTDENNRTVLYLNDMVLPWPTGTVPLGPTPSTVGPFYAIEQEACVCPPVPPPVVTPDPCWCPDITLPIPDPGSCW